MSEQPGEDEEVVVTTNPGQPQPEEGGGEAVFDPDTGVQMTGGSAPAADPTAGPEGTAGAYTEPAEPTSSGEYANPESESE